MNEVTREKIPLLDRLKFAGKAGLFAVTGQWEGSEMDRFRNRPAPRRGSQDRDLNLGKREDMMAEARTLTQTVPIVGCILRRYRNYVVGECNIKFTTDDKDLNRQAERQFKAWSRVCDYRGQHSLRSLAGLLVVSRVRCGDFFVNEPEDPEFYWLEGIEGDRVTNAKSATINIDEKNIVGGVKIGSRGQPEGYIVCDRERVNGFETGNYINPQTLDAANVMHYFDSLRYDAYRGVTMFGPVLNAIRDLKETIQAERTAQKIHSRLAMIVKKAMGGAAAATPFNNMRTTVTANGTEKQVEEVADGVIKYMFPNEDITAHLSNRPGNGWFELTLFFIREISIALDLPFEFVWSMAGLAGTATRLVSKQAERTFEQEQILLDEKFLTRVGTRWILKEQQNGRLPNNPDLLDSFHFQWPAHPSVDAGYDSASDVAECEAGITPEDDLHAKRGGDGEANRIKSQNSARHRLTLAFDLQEEFKRNGREVDVHTCLTLMGRPNAKLNVQPMDVEAEAEDDAKIPEPSKKAA